MPPEVAAPLVLVALGLVAVVALGSAIAGIVRDSDWWVIVRGETTGKVARVQRFAARQGWTVPRG